MLPQFLDRIDQVTKADNFCQVSQRSISDPRIRIVINRMDRKDDNTATVLQLSSAISIFSLSNEHSAYH